MPVGVVHWWQHFCLLFSESFQNPTFITETQMCHLLCAVCYLLGWTLVSPCPGDYGLFTSPMLFLESVLIKCASWINSFLLISYFLRDFLFQTFSLIFIFTTIFLQVLSVFVSKQLDFLVTASQNCQSYWKLLLSPELTPFLHSALPFVYLLLSVLYFPPHFSWRITHFDWLNFFWMKLTN